METCLQFVICTSKTCLDTNQDVILTLLQIISMPIGSGLPSPAMLLLNRPIKCLLPEMYTEPIKINNDDAQHEVLKGHQIEYVKNNDNKKIHLFFSIESTVAVQWEDGRPWIHGVIGEANGSDHKGQSCMIEIMKTGKLIIWNRKYLCNISITMKQYICKQIKKAARQLEDTFMKNNTSRPQESAQTTHSRLKDTYE